MIIKLPESFFALGQFCYLGFFSCRRSASITSYHRPDRDWSVILCALPPPFCLNSAVPPWLPLHGNCHRGCLSCCFYRPPHDICCRWLRSVLHGLRSGLGVECARLLLSNDRVFLFFGGTYEQHKSNPCPAGSGGS